ncbi:MAG TPA: sigma 54-interacting transcriptional regulator [Candidatus Binatus sp.]|nr:sigma 54-interacting transcriptional regulator [Candidatus Binatus sp.]
MASQLMDSILGGAPAVAALREQIEHLAAFDRPGSPHLPTVLIQGETGTGKGLVAHLVHARGARAAGPFVDVNCAAIPETMLEAELFGFEAGAFTDARRAKPGLFEVAAGGSLFLDEVDALPLVLQGKLLKVIEEKTVRRLGAVTPYRIDAKLIAATQRDLRELVATRAFRADLFHRLAVVILDLPPLRARGDDVLLLADHFLAEHASAHGLELRRLTASGRNWLRACHWPGNVRELSHLMERVTLLCPELEVDVDALERLRVPLGPSTEAPATLGGDDTDEAMRIRDALVRAGGNVVRAARILGIGRNALRHRMRRHGIERPTDDDLASPPPPRRRKTETPPAAATPPVSPEPSWEQKVIAVLAIDMAFPASAPEPWTVAREWQRTVEERIAGFGGVFVARTPSRLVAAFGIPRALEQLPQRAVQSALALRRLAAGEAPTRRPELRMALHIGTIRLDTHAPAPAATILGVGDALALPERLLGHAGAGEILVSAAVARRIDDGCELAPRTLRIGESERVAAAAVLGQRGRPGAVAPAAETRFVGRERDLGLLRSTFERAAADQGRVVLVVGEPGIGKSRLLAELRAGLAGEPHLWVECRCASYATSAAFHPVSDGLRRFFAIDDRDDATSAAAKVERGIGSLGPGVGWTLPFVRQVLALDAGDAAVTSLDSASRRSETFRALKTIFFRSAERTPLVLVVEDLHWIDPASEEFLTFLADAVPATRTLLVCSYRPGYRQPFGDRSYQMRISLEALSAAEMAEVTDSLLGTGEVPGPLRAIIAAKAEGNPFFVEEVTRSLLEDGSLRRENGRVVLARDLAEVAVPDTIQDVLIARIDRLADDARRAIQVAAVIGREFAFRLLERITEAGAHVRTQVEELRSLELIFEKVAHPELAFMFKHALTHDVAYESVLDERRRELHRTIALAIEELYADRLPELYETLAHHFERAEEWEPALDYHERAARKAADSFANRAVIDHCHRALAIAERLGERVPDERRRALEEHLGAACFYTSQFSLSADSFERAAGLSSEPAAQSLNLSNAGLSAFWSHAYARANAATDAAASLAQRHGLPAIEVLAGAIRSWQLGVCDGNLTAWASALAELDRGSETAGDDAALAMVRFLLAMHAEWTGEYRKAIAFSEQCVAAGRRLRLPHLVVWPEWFLGKAYCCLGDYGRAVARLTEATEVCERIGDRVWTSRLLNTLGWCFAEIGSVVRAREHNERAAALAHAAEDPEIIANSEINLAANWVALGDVERALGHLEPIRGRLASAGDPWMRWRYALHALDVAGRVALVRSRPEQALEAAEEELAGARRHHVTKVEARALVLRGEALVAMDRRQDAEPALREAARVAEAIGYPRAVWQALRLESEVARRAGRQSEVEHVEARRRAVLVKVAGSLEDEELRRDLRSAHDL